MLSGQQYDLQWLSTQNDEVIALKNGSYYDYVGVPYWTIEIASGGVTHVEVLASERCRAEEMAVLVASGIVVPQTLY